MTPPSSDSADGSPPTALLAAPSLLCGLLAGWALTGAGFAAVEALLVGGVAALAVYSCLRYAATRLST